MCAGLNKTTCCDKVAATDNTTKVCQYVVCNGTEGKITMWKSELKDFEDSLI